MALFKNIEVLRVFIGTMDIRHVRFNTRNAVHCPCAYVVQCGNV